jgi:hypothetical protein
LVVVSDFHIICPSNRSDFEVGIQVYSAMEARRIFSATIAYLGNPLIDIVEAVEPSLDSGFSRVDLRCVLPLV